MPSSALPTTADLLRVTRVEGSHRVALRAALSVGLPLLLCVLGGHPTWAAAASFGAFTSLYGRNHSHIVRLRMQAVAALTMTTAVVTGVLVGVIEGSGWWQQVGIQGAWLQVGVATVIAATGEVVARANHFHPPGPLFMIFAFGALSSTPHRAADLPAAALVAAGAALFSMLVGVTGIVRDPRGVRRAVAQEERLRLAWQPSWKPAWMALGVALSGSIAVALHIGHPYWAMVSAVAPLGAPHVTHQVTRAVQRIVGTTVGLGTAWIALALHLRPAEVVLLIAALQFCTEMLVGANYALALLMITPMALLMGQLGHARPIGELLYDRGVETVVGSGVGMCLILTGHVIRRRRLERRAVAGAAG